MGRAALWALGLGVLSPAVIACSSDDNTTGAKPLYGGPPVEEDSGPGPAPAYGAPIVDSGLEPDVHATPAYGAPGMPIDAGLEPDAADASDASDGEDADAGDAG